MDHQNRGYPSPKAGPQQSSSPSCCVPCLSGGPDLLRPHDLPGTRLPCTRPAAPLLLPGLQR